MTGEDLDLQPPASGLVRRLRVSSRALRLLALGLPLAAMTSVLAGSGRETAWAVPRSVSSANQAWLNQLVGPAPTVSPEETPPPNLAVVPLDGDPQVLVLPAPNQPTTPPATGAAALASVAGAASGPDTGGLTSNGIPRRVLQAYVAAAQQAARLDPSCHIPWSLLAGIGRVESDHGRFGGSHVTASGEITPPIYGPLLDGSNGMGYIRDTDGGRLDGSATLDRAVGPMQFIPGTWAAFGTDANGDGVADPQNIDDAALSAARYLCAGGGDLSTPEGRFQAVFRYNGSTSYVQLVLALADSYATGRPVPVAAEPAEPVPAVAVGSGTSATGGSPPVVDPDPSPTHSPSPSRTRTPSPTPTTTAPTHSPTPTPSHTPTPTPSHTPTPTPSHTPTPTPSHTPTPTPSTPSPTTSTPAPTTSTSSPSTSTSSSTPSTSSSTPSTTSTPAGTTASSSPSSSPSSNDSSTSRTPSASPTTSTPSPSVSPSPSSASPTP